MNGRLGCIWKRDEVTTGATIRAQESRVTFSPRILPILSLLTHCVSRLAIATSPTLKLAMYKLKAAKNKPAIGACEMQASPSAAVRFTATRRRCGPSLWTSTRTRRS
eukprot:scaffold1764_cov236-Pinguiococcus_pyrenoidosus.AAC.5